MGVEAAVDGVRFGPGSMTRTAALGERPRARARRLMTLRNDRRGPVEVVKKPHGRKPREALRRDLARSAYVVSGLRGLALSL